MSRIELRDARGQLDNLIRTALDGEEVIITKDDEPILKLVRIPSFEVRLGLYRKVRETKTRRQSGSAKGMIAISDDFDEPLEDFKDYMQ